MTHGKPIHTARVIVFAVVLTAALIGAAVEAMEHWPRAAPANATACPDALACHALKRVSTAVAR